MFDRKEYRADFLRYLPRAVEVLVNKCRVLPPVEPDGSSDCPFAERLYFEKEEAVLDVKQLRADREKDIKGLERSIEEVQNTSTEPWWANEDDKIAHTPHFEGYCRDKWAKEEEIRVEARRLRDSIFRLRIDIEMIDEFLAKAAKKRFPRTPRDQYGNAPGQKVVRDPIADRDKDIRKFLEGS